jgi:RimJ/RimL family protein N-acetyltransferase
VRLTDGVVVLREWRDADVQPAVVATADPEIPRWTPIPRPNTAENIRAFLAEPLEGRVRLVIADPQTEELIGSVGIVAVDEARGEGEIGYWVAAEHRGRGAATRAVRLLTDWALGERGLRRVVLHIDPENVNSRRVAEKAGFAFEAIIDGETVRDGLGVVALYALDR